MAWDRRDVGTDETFLSVDYLYLLSLTSPAALYRGDFLGFELSKVLAEKLPVFRISNHSIISLEYQSHRG